MGNRSPFSCGLNFDKRQDPSLWLYLSFAVNAIRGRLARDQMTQSQTRDRKEMDSVKFVGLMRRGSRGRCVDCPRIWLRQISSESC